MPVSRRRLVIPAAVAGVLVLLWLGRGPLWRAVNLAILESEHRVAGLQVARVLDVLAIGPGDRVADIGAGTGVFARPMARRVGESGRVYAVDIDEELLAYVAESAARQALSSLSTVRAAPDDPRLPEPVDLIFLCNTLHHMDDPGAYLVTLRRYLRPGGRVAVIDFRPGESPHLRDSRRLSREDLGAEMAAAGYVLAANHDFLEENYFFVWACPDCRV